MISNMEVEEFSVEIRYLLAEVEEDFPQHHGCMYPQGKATI